MTPLMINGIIINPCVSLYNRRFSPVAFQTEQTAVHSIPINTAHTFMHYSILYINIKIIRNAGMCSTEYFSPSGVLVADVVDPL